VTYQVLGEDRAAERGERRADDRHAQLLAHDIDADRGGGLLVLRDRIKRLAVDAAVDQAPDCEPAEPQRERDRIERHAERNADPGRDGVVVPCRGRRVGHDGIPLSCNAN
jgi:hypothetical protein